MRSDLRISDITWPAKNYDAYFRPGEAQDRARWFGSLQTGSRDASGHFYRRNRCYDAASGHFTQSDPIGLAGGLNTYGFAGATRLPSQTPSVSAKLISAILPLAQLAGGRIVTHIWSILIVAGIHKGLESVAAGKPERKRARCPRRP